MSPLVCALMSEEQLKAFFEKVKVDTSLQEKLKAAADSDAVLAIAKEEGFVISFDDLKSTQSEVSDEELEGVAGGAINLSTVEHIFDQIKKDFVDLNSQYRGTITDRY